MSRTGDWVIFASLPSWVPELPPQSQQVFQFCLGRSYRVDEVLDDGVLVLDVSPDIDARFGGYMNDIRVEPEYVVDTDPPKPG
jgi:hypothetical protein